jgi:nucleoside-diphosphate-sugar epimerase
MKILVCGATGFLGRNIRDRLLASGEHEVYGVCNTRPPYDEGDWYQRDLTLPCELDGVDVVIQAAGVTSGCGDTFSQPWLHVTDNAIMNSHIMRAAFEAKVKHVIFFSCSTMYGGGHCSEKTPIDYHPRYLGMVTTKLYIEKVCEFFAGQGDTKFTVIRGSNFFGAHDKFSLERAHVFGATVTKVMQATDTVNVWGDGKEGRDLLYVDDLVDFVECALKNQTKNFGLYNVGGGFAFTITEIVQHIIDASGKNLSIEYDTSKPTIPVNVSLDCTLADVELGWQKKTSLFDGIAKTLEWYKAKA